MYEIGDDTVLYRTDVTSLGLPIMALTYQPAGCHPRWWRRLWLWCRQQLARWI